MILPDEVVFSKYDDVIAEMDDDLENVQTAVSAHSAQESQKLVPVEDGRGSGAVSEAVSVRLSMYLVLAKGGLTLF